MSRTNLAGIGLMCLGLFLFAVNDVVGKWLVATYSVAQVLLIRSAAALVILMPLALKEGIGPLFNPPNLKIHILRTVFGTLEVASFYWAVTYLPLMDVMTYYLAGPIYVAAIAPFLLREKRLDAPRWALVILGFVGVLVVLRPSAATLTGPAIIAVSGSLLFAGLILTTRMVKDASGTVLVTWQMMGALLFGALLMPFGATMPTGKDFALLLMLGIVAMMAHVCVAQSLKLAPATVVSPYQYTLIVWGAVFGWFVFGDWPDAATITGSLLIIAAGLGLARLDASARQG
jgi:drug/metabolite transporter (DMT)-like permease